MRGSHGNCFEADSGITLFGSLERSNDPNSKQYGESLKQLKEAITKKWFSKNMKAFGLAIRKHIHLRLQIRQSNK